MAENKIVSFKIVQYPRDTSASLVHTESYFSAALLQYDRVNPDKNFDLTKSYGVVFIAEPIEASEGKKDTLLAILPTDGYIIASLYLRTILTNFLEGKHKDSLIEPLQLRPPHETSIVVAKSLKNPSLGLEGFNDEELNLHTKETLETELTAMQGLSRKVDLEKIVRVLQRKSWTRG